MVVMEEEGHLLGGAARLVVAWILDNPPRCSSRLGTLSGPGQHDPYPRWLPLGEEEFARNSSPLGEDISRSSFLSGTRKELPLRRPLGRRKSGPRHICNRGNVSKQYR
ncbi:hypothetical protein Dimus_003291 [Dionaea muscipula]